MEELIVGQELIYNELIYLSGEAGLTRTEYGSGNIGESFITFSNSKDHLYSFIMTGYTTEGIYRLIYKYNG